MTAIFYISAIALALIGVFSFGLGIESNLEGNVIGSQGTLMLGIMMVIAAIVISGVLSHNRDDSYFYRKLTSLFYF